jgi:hypothetical protein
MMARIKGSTIPRWLAMVLTGVALQLAVPPGDARSVRDD